MNSVLFPKTVTITENSENINEAQQTIFSPLELPKIKDKPVQLNFDGGQLSSDAGLLLLKEVEHHVGIIKALAEIVDDPRDARYVKFDIVELMMQRVSQIAAGYEDANDCNELRDDPIFKILAGRFPESDGPLASQPTMSRFENSITRRYLHRLAYTFADIFIASYEKEPKIIVLDFDDTEDKVHGHQQLSLFNNYFKEHCYMPLHVYEGMSGKLITTILKAGKRSTGKQMFGIARRIITYLRAHWPNTIIIFRGDAHFAYPEIMEWIDKQDNVMFVIGLTGNAILHKMAELLISRANRLYEYTKRKVTLFHSVYYKAETWSRYRRVIIKVEVSSDGLNVRYIVTDMVNAKAQVLYQQVYCARGKAELFIKEHKLYLKSDRTSCSRFFANQFRLFLHSAAYVLIHALRTNILKHTQWANASIEKIRLKLFKVGARVKELKTRIKIELPSAYPYKETLCRSFQIFEALSPG